MVEHGGMGRDEWSGIVQSSGMRYEKEEEEEEETLNLHGTDCLQVFQEGSGRPSRESSLDSLV